ncbi:short chain dehydrogenase [Embleya scabrispora]|uniref:Short chain dehydrogenase n=1 Tax=Embleya scabrispora TaxID=159449 RepID=A0A1T3NPZ9_9ACTN|nr:short chain dehydrogenase [Embleya scabrispora]
MTAGASEEVVNEGVVKAARAADEVGSVRARSVVSGGVRLAVYEQGPVDGPLVLLVHGYPDTHHVWDDVAADLAHDHRVVRYDVRGAGASGAPGSRYGYRLEQLAADLFAVLDAVSPDRPAHLLAHDWGSIQAWEAVTDRAGPRRIASYTSISGPCLDHVGHWARRRLARPTPRHLRQLAAQSARSWYIAAFHLPMLAPAAWRSGLAARWGGLLARAEGVRPRAGHPQATLADDAVRGIALYRANMLPRMLLPGRRETTVPVQLITLAEDSYVGAALSEDLDRWVPRLWRRTIAAAHWSALLEKGPTVARMTREFAAHVDHGTTTPDLDAARRHERPPGKDPFAGRLALITGAGGGIGRATAVAFAEQGADVVVCDIDSAGAERTAELARLYGRSAHVYRVDVSDGAAVDAFAAKVAAAHGVPDIVVNNAGVGHYGTFLATTDAEWKRVLDVNLWGVVHGCRAFGTLLAERGEGGHIVNIASAAAYTPSKMLAAYATTKAAVAMLSDCLRAELAGSGVRVTTIHPGIVNTGITRSTTFSGMNTADQAAHRERASRLYARRDYPPEKVADRIVGAIRHRQAVAPITPEARVAWWLSRLSPTTMRLLARAGIA